MSSLSMRGGALVLSFVVASAATARAEEPAGESAAPPLPTAPRPADETATTKEKAPPPPAPGAIIATEDGWTFFTTGRISNFASWAKGEGMPQATTYDVETGAPKHQVLTGTGGTGLAPQSSRPVLKMDGTPSMALTSTIDSWRMRSGFVGNQFVFGGKRRLGDNLVTALVEVRSIVDSQSQKKYFQNPPDVRQGYMTIEGAWGTVLAGRTAVLFDRGAVETDFLYLHGYGLGFPGDLHSSSAFPTAGQIGFGVLANGYSAGVVYTTPTIAGVQLSVGAFDPASLTGSTIERTKFVRPEFELLVDEPLGALGKLHLYANGGIQGNYQQDKPDDVVKYLYGLGYGGRVELGPVHVAGGGHWGRGLGLAYPGLPSDAVYDNASNLRYTSGFFGMLQLVLGKFDLDAGYGKSTIRMTTVDLTGTVDPVTGAQGDPTNSVIHTQAAVSAAVVFHARSWLHFAVDDMYADSEWDLGEHQKINFLNLGTTVTW
jgi:hypothetical protein